jgi:predicted O-methyltransferase YrrM
VLDDLVRNVLARLEREDAEERERGLPASERARQVARTTGQFLFALVAPQADCEILEIGGSRGYSTIWLAAGARYLGGHVLSLETDPRKVEAWCRNIADPGLEDPLARYSAARQADPTLESVTVPLDRGLELSVALR